MSAGREFDFVAWQARQVAKRHARRNELRAAFAQGFAVWHGRSLWSTAGIVHPADDRNPVTHASAAFIEPHQSDPVYLAEHLENREYGFGLPTTIVRTVGQP